MVQARPRTRSVAFRPQLPGCTAACRPRAQVPAAASQQACATPKRSPRSPTVASRPHPCPAATQHTAAQPAATNLLGRLVEEKEGSGTGNPLVSSRGACALSTPRVNVTIRAARRPAPGFAGRHVGSWQEKPDCLEPLPGERSAFAGASRAAFAAGTGFCLIEVLPALCCHRSRRTAVSTRLACANYPSGWGSE